MRVVDSHSAGLALAPQTRAICVDRAGGLLLNGGLLLGGGLLLDGLSLISQVPRLALINLNCMHIVPRPFP